MEPAERLRSGRPLAEPKCASTKLPDTFLHFFNHRDRVYGLTQSYQSVAALRGSLDRRTPTLPEHEILHYVGPAWLIAVELLCLTHYFVRDWLCEPCREASGDGAA